MIYTLLTLGSDIDLVHVNTPDSRGMSMMLTCVLAVNSFVMVDSDASHSYVSERFNKDTGIVPEATQDF